jgi:hypothetical protein
MGVWKCVRIIAKAEEQRASGIKCKAVVASTDADCLLWPSSRQLPATATPCPPPKIALPHSAPRRRGAADSGQGGRPVRAPGKHPRQHQEQIGLLHERPSIQAGLACAGGTGGLRCPGRPGGTRGRRQVVADDLRQRRAGHAHHSAGPPGHDGIAPGHGELQRPPHACGHGRRDQGRRRRLPGRHQH